MKRVCVSTSFVRASISYERYGRRGRGGKREGMAVEEGKRLARYREKGAHRVAVDAYNTDNNTYENPYDNTG